MHFLQMLCNSYNVEMSMQTFRDYMKSLTINFDQRILKESMGTFLSSIRWILFFLNPDINSTRSYQFIQELKTFEDGLTDVIQIKKLHQNPFKLKFSSY